MKTGKPPMTVVGIATRFALLLLAALVFGSIAAVLVDLIGGKGLGYNWIYPIVFAVAGSLYFWVVVFI